MRVNSATKVANPNVDELDGKNTSNIGVNGLVGVEQESAENSTSPNQVTAACPEGRILAGTGFDVFGSKVGTSPNAQTNVMMILVIPVRTCSASLGCGHLLPSTVRRGCWWTLCLTNFTLSLERAGSKRTT
jgi:hypothetical protein